MNPDLPMPIRGLRGEVYKSREVKYENDFSSSEYIEFIPEGHSELKNVLFSPLNVHGKTVGLLGLANKPGGFNQNDAKLAKTFGELAAIALLNSRNIDKLRSLHQGMQLLQKCESEEKLCQKAVEVTKNILDYDLCVFYCYENNALNPKAISSQEFSGKVTSYAKGHGLAGKTIEKKQTIWGDDLSKWKEEEENLSGRFHSYLSVPIGELGVVQMFSVYKNEYKKQSVELAEILAGHLNEEVKRIRLEEKLKKQAIHDSLTGLYNRYFFNQTIEKEVKRANRYNKPLGFLMIDINKFKQINDSYSHLTGDKVLTKIAQLLKKSIRGSDTVFRYGGDEFLITLPETKNRIQKIKDRIRDNVKKWNKEQKLIDSPLELAIGFSFYDPDKKEKIQDILKKADQKMYEDKRKP